MWIRNQRKNALVNINFLRVINDGNYCLICGATTDGYDCELGVYSTEEKALDVLAEIQELIEDKQFCKTYKAEFENLVLNNGVQVYQMPQDEEDFKFEKCCFGIILVFPIVILWAIWKEIRTLFKVLKELGK